MARHVAVQLLLGATGLLLALPTCAQVLIGAERGALLAELGPRVAIYSTPLGKDFPLSQESFVIDAGAFRDVWIRKTANNAFRVSALYGLDGTKSRLAPTARLAKLVFVPDHDELASGMLNELREVRALCQQGCQVFGERSAGDYQMHVCAGVIGQDEALAAGSYSGWEDREPVGEYVICATIYYVRPPDPRWRYPSAKKMDWKSLNVDYISLSGNKVSDLRKKDDEGLLGNFFVELDQWVPY